MTDIPTNHTDNAGKVRKSSLLDRLSSSIIRIRKNPGLSLLGLNIILALIVFFIFDPFGWIRTSYLDADSFLDVEPARIDLIQVVDLSNPENSGFSIQRGGAVAVESDQDALEGVEPSEERKLLNAVQGFQWILKPTVRSDQEATSSSEPDNKSLADAQRISRLLFSLKKSRLYYELDNSSEHRKDFDLDRGLKLSVILDNGNRRDFVIGRSSIRGNESYVLVDDSVYLVQENLRRDLGAGNAAYFRNRQILPISSRNSITRLDVRFKNPALAGLRNVELARAGGDWKMLEPEVGSVLSTEMNLLLDDLLEICANEFLDEIPPRLDGKQAMELSLVYRTSIGNPETVTLDVLGKKSYDTYLFRTRDGQLFEGSSLYLEKLLAPTQLLDRGEQPMDFTMP